MDIQRARLGGAPSREDLRIEIFDGDLDPRALALALGMRQVAWDLETTGLEWRTERIGTSQLLVGESVFIVRPREGERPARLMELLHDPRVMKILHHAMFDLRFMMHLWQAIPQNVACTKIAAKLAMPGLAPERYSLAPLIDDLFGELVDKSQRMSDWMAPTLTPEQIAYACDDVRFLPRLLAWLRAILRLESRLAAYEATLAYLPTRAAQDLEGHPDLFQY